MVKHHWSQEVFFWIFVGEAINNMMQDPGLSSTRFTNERYVVLEGEVAFNEMTELRCFNGGHKLIKQVSLAVNCMYNLLIL